MVGEGAAGARVGWNFKMHETCAARTTTIDIIYDRYNKRAFFILCARPKSNVTLLKTGIFFKKTYGDETTCHRVRKRTAGVFSLLKLLLRTHTILLYYYTCSRYFYRTPGQTPRAGVAGITLKITHTRNNNSPPWCTCVGFRKKLNDLYGECKEIQGLRQCRWWWLWWWR